MTREEFVKHAEQEIAQVLSGQKNRIMNLVQQAWAEGKRNAEVDTAIDIIKEAVYSIKPQKTYAHWKDEEDRASHWHCSNCGTVQGWASLLMKYCPNCGAEMAEHPQAACGVGQTFSP